MTKLDAKTIEEAMKYQMDAVLRKANDAVNGGNVTIELLCFLQEQIIMGCTMRDDEHEAILQSLNEIVIDEDMRKKMSKCKTGKDLILRFYDELQKGFPEEQKSLLHDIFYAVTEWVKQQK